ncbi:MAG: 1-acyl-sn-glycerol-3-phosphate acyltransferase [Polyangiaceae bacterium]
MKRKKTAAHPAAKAASKPAAKPTARTSRPAPNHRSSKAPPTKKSAPVEAAPESEPAPPTPRAGTAIKSSMPHKKRSIPAPPPTSAEIRADATAAPGSDPDAASVEAQIRELDARLDKMIDQASQRSLPASDDDDDDDDDDEFETRRTIPVPRPSQAGPPSSRPLQALQAEGSAVFDTARELLSTDYYLRHWGKLGMRGRSEEVDDFGYDPVYEERFRPFFNFLYSTYFRVETEGLENVPSEGRCLLVANHSGTLPYDGIMLKTAMKREHPSKRDVRWLAEDFIFHFPFLGSFTNRVGAVRACQENAERLLKQDALVAVFPEGVKGIGKLFKERYRLQRFGRGGFIKLCLRTKTPIVPVAIIGAEETNPMLFRIEAFSRALGVPYIPVTPTFPLLGPLGLAPAPTKWKIVFGELISLAEHGPEAADDDILVGRLAERVRASVQAMVDKAIGSRRSIFFG